MGDHEWHFLSLRWHFLPDRVGLGVVESNFPLSKSTQPLFTGPREPSQTSIHAHNIQQALHAALWALAVGTCNDLALALAQYIETNSVMALEAPTPLHDHS